MAEFKSEVFGKRVAVLRKERGMTQKRLAVAMGIDPTVISTIENGKRFSFDIFIAFTTFFGVSSDYLLGFSENRAIYDLKSLNEDIDDLILAQLHTFSLADKERLLRHLELENSLNSYSNEA